MRVRSFQYCLPQHCKDNVSVYSMDPFVIDSMAAFQATKQRCKENVKTALRFVGQEQKYQQWALIQDLQLQSFCGLDPTAGRSLH